MGSREYTRVLPTAGTWWEHKKSCCYRGTHLAHHGADHDDDAGADHDDIFLYGFHDADADISYMC